MPASFVVRRVVATLEEQGDLDDRVEVFQSIVSGRFLLGFRSPALRFDRRLGPESTAVENRALITAEVANVLNLSWYGAADVSSDGEVLLLVTAPFEKD